MSPKFLSRLVLAQAVAVASLATAGIARAGWAADSGPDNCTNLIPGAENQSMCDVPAQNLCGPSSGNYCVKNYANHGTECITFICSVKP